MANSNLVGKHFEISNSLLKKLKTNLEKYGEGNPNGSKRARNLITNKTISYEEIKRIKNFFDNYEGDGTDVEYKLNGGDVGEKWVNNSLSNARNVIDSKKKVRMDGGEENQYKKTHTKDRDNANPTGVGLVKIHKGSNMKNIMNNTTTYESVNEEIDKIIKLNKQLIK